MKPEHDVFYRLMDTAFAAETGLVLGTADAAALTEWLRRRFGPLVEEAEEYAYGHAGHGSECAYAGLCAALAKMKDGL